MNTLIKSIESDQRFRFLWELKSFYPKSRVYLVGGLIRDRLLGRESQDYDFVVENISATELEPFLTAHGQIVVDSDTKTAVYKFLPRLNYGLRTLDSGLVVDIALPRLEEYEDSGNRKPIKVETEGVKLSDDLSRRDFTINAMAVELPLGKPLATPLKSHDTPLIDLFNGQSDLKAGIIRAVGDPKLRFHEDPLRILRAVRFACQLDFQLEAKTLEAAKQTKDQISSVIASEKECHSREGGNPAVNGSPAFRLRPPSGRGDDIIRNRVSAERIQKELTLSLANPLYFFDLWDKIGLFELLIPEIDALKGIPQPGNWHAEGDAFVHTRLCLENLIKKDDIALILATLLHDIGKKTTFQSAEETGDRIRFNDHDKISAEMAAVILARLRFDNKTIDKVIWLIRSHMKLILDFPKMRLSKQKALILNPFFDDLVALTTADASSSLRPDGSVDLSFVEKAQTIQAKLLAEIEAGKPLEIINGDQIMEILNENKIGFDGPLIGRLKSEINDAYADEKISTLEEAGELVLKLVAK
jgi:poly(A) polymerase